MIGGKVDGQCFLAWCVLPWICLAGFIGLVMWLCSLVGGAATLFSAVACAIVFWVFFKQAGREKGAGAKAFGYSASALFASCFAVIVMGGING